MNKINTKLVSFLSLLLLTESFIKTEEFTDSQATQLDLKTIMSKTIPFRNDGKIYIPDNIKHVKLDIGLSYYAPMSQYWLTHEDDLMVFGFEPEPGAVQSIMQNGGRKLREADGTPLEKRFLGEQFFLIPCALGLSKSNVIKFYVVKDKYDCSSICLPKSDYFNIERIVEIPIFSLADFFDLFPFDIHPIIDYIKIDTQGTDLDIAKSAGHHLQERVIYITLEAENGQYESTVNSIEDIDEYMHHIGFIRVASQTTSDPTYLNLKFSDHIKNHNIQIYQRG